MKYSTNGKIIYEAGDWITKLNGIWNGIAVHNIGICKIENGFLYWTRKGEVTTKDSYDSQWELDDIRPATQAEINRALGNEKIIVGEYEVKFLYDADNIANSIKVGCQEVLKETFLKIGKKAGWI